jgi:hypothetical protein
MRLGEAIVCQSIASQHNESSGMKKKTLLLFGVLTKAFFNISAMGDKHRSWQKINVSERDCLTR